MCGRYVVATPPEELQRLFGTENDLPNFAPTWNMAPTRQAPVVRLHPETHARHLDLLRWGLLPHWVRGDPKKVRQPINARAETVATSPMFRDAFARRRCLVPIDAFYEWQVLPGGGKRPHAVARADGQVMALAGLWEGWRGDGGETVRSYTVVTTNAVDQLGYLHERMPVVLERAEWPAWLGEVPADAKDLGALLTRPSAAAFRAWPVSTRVNSVRNDGPELLAPAD
jgi:putative SOS response-associated peptidase YedK